MYVMDTAEIGTGQTQEEAFDDYLDEMLGDVRIGLLSYQPSRVLRMVDPIAYRCEYLAWLDMEERS